FVWTQRFVSTWGFLSYPGFGAGGGGTPAQQAAFGDGQQPLGEQRDDGRDDHSGVDAGGVERALGVVDQQAQALVGTGVLADHRADEREPERRVQRGDDPRGGAGYHDRGQHLHPPGAQDPGVVDQVAIDLAGALEGVEEHREEHQYHGRGDLGG